MALPYRTSTEIGHPLIGNTMIMAQLYDHHEAPMHGNAYPKHYSSFRLVVISREDVFYKALPTRQMGLQVHCVTETSYQCHQVR